MHRAPVATVVLLITAAGGVPAMTQASSQTPPDPVAVIQRQLEAFNRHDVEAMTANVADDFAWFAVDPARVALELSGRNDFRLSMSRYFEAFPQARAAIEESFAVGRFVTVRERAYWRGRGGGEESQAALAVYEIVDGLIQRVWYYSAVE